MWLETKKSKNITDVKTKEKKIYYVPQLEVVTLDNEIVLVLATDDPPIEPSPVTNSPIHEDQNTNSPWE